MGRAGDAARLLRHAGASLVVRLVVVELAVAAVPLGIIGAVGVVVGRVAGHATMAGPLALLIALLLLQQALGPLRANVAYRVTRRVDGAVRALVMALANRPVGIAALEDATILDRLEIAGGVVDPFWSASPGGAAVGIIALGGRYLQVVGAAVLVARLSVPVAVGLVSVTVFGYHRSRRWNRVRLRAVRENNLAGRASRYTSGLANTPPAAKEVRLFGVLDWLEDRFRGQWDEVVSARLTPWRWAATRVAVLIVGGFPVVAVGFVAAGRTASERGLGARTVAVGLQAAVAFFTLLFDQRQDDAYQVDFGLEALDTLRALESAMDDVDSRGTIDAAGLPRLSIRFEQVRFAYPGSEREVFVALDLTIAAGTSVAIVGVNGAGKTTLIKLLAGLHEPQGGRILADDVSLRELDVVSWRRRLAVIFQDFVRYELPAADNVGFGSVDHLDDVAARERAAARAGASDLIERLPSGWATPLNRQYRGGADLSGGQWQRIALARALTAVEAGAGVLVLDEPTANLDVRAEAALFDDFLDLTRGLTTILISHRFSTVRHADRICLLEDGLVVEDGSHDELMAAGGRYAELFGLQAQRFRE